MPVSLLSFDASSSSNQVYLTWATATEVNNEGFQVERSGDGSSWNAVSFVGGAGNSNSIRQYEYLDHPGRSGLYYYRLKQIDIDGQFTLSPIRQVRMIGEEALSVRNTLVYDLLTVDISRGQPGFTLGLYSITGQLLQSIKVEPGAQSISIPLDRLAAGSYLVRTIGLPELKVWKIIKY